jgi:hypothetical protein
MLGRLLFGIIKGLIVGALVGFALAKLGMASPAMIVAYLAAASAGVLVGLIAGKPIWAKDAKIEAGMKAAVGALLAAGLMYAARRFLTMPLPFALGPFSSPGASIGETAITSLAAVAALLGGFYEADNDEAEAPPPKLANKRVAPGNKRIAASKNADELDEDPGAEADEKHAKK